MNKEVIGLIVGTIVIFLSFVFVCGTFLYLYLRDQKLVVLPSHPYRERLSAIAVFVRGIHLSSNTRWMGLLIRKPCSIFMFKTVTIPWGTTKFLKDYTREDMLAPSITRYSNSFVSFKRLMQTHFPPSFGADGLV